jgi:hypothetical protein
MKDKATNDRRPSEPRTRGREERVTQTAPYFSLACALWIPAVLAWDAATGALRRIEGPEGVATYRQAVEASRFLALAVARDT